MKILPRPCKLSSKEVAMIWLENEHTFYTTNFHSGAITRLTAVIERARNDGFILGKHRAKQNKNKEMS